MTTSQLLKIIKPLGGAWNAASHAWFEAQLSNLNDGGYLLCPTAGVVLQKVGNGWKVI